MHINQKEEVVANMEIINNMAQQTDKVLEELLDNLLKNSIDLDDEFAEIVNNNFWNLI